MRWQLLQKSKELSHPHILRHSRAIELLKAGVPCYDSPKYTGPCLSDNNGNLFADIRPGGKEYTQRKGVDIRYDSTGIY